MNQYDKIFPPENFYHIYNRGNNKELLFQEDENYRYFLKRLHDYFDPCGIAVVAYCLMPNHFHVLVYIQREVNFSNVMRSFTSSYVKSFLKWSGRTGHLFEGDFQSRMIERDGYLEHICRYIHLNPVKANLVTLPEQWEYSDYREWIMDNPATSGTDSHQKEVGDFSKHRLRNELFGSGQEYKKFVMDFEAERKNEHLINKLLFG